MTETSIRVAVAGAAGRMGRMLVSAVNGATDLCVTGAVAHPDAAEKGADSGELAGVGHLGVPIVGNIAETDDFDVLVDFSVATATLGKLEFCTDNGKALVIGTTGFEEAGLEMIRRAAESVPIVMAPNMSVGVNVAFKLIEFAARALGDDVDVEVFEAHHRHKIDAPSGTAVRMGEILADTLDRDIATDAVYGREGITGEREGRAIGFHSLRGGDIVGEHTVTFAGTGERIEITHRAGSRENFAAGAVRAVRFVVGQNPGLYGMDEVLGL
ncbi:MAG: 4-hydroxy-tetrahydrodipicolinate reductase [Gammaproteobacteria bacterium]|nr:4-hydroxy-tetrahydrodipicolinate reductase [Gammaproteobacteria bacterium]